MRSYRVARARMPNRVGQQGSLTVVEVGDAGEQPIELPNLSGLAVQPAVQVFHGAADHVQLVRDEVREVVSVGLRVQKGPPVLAGLPSQDARDGDVLGEPVALGEQRPVEDRPGGTAVAVDERMVVTDPEVQHDGSQDGMEEGVLGPIPCVGEPAHRFQAFLELASRGRAVENGSVSVHDPNAVRLASKLPGLLRVRKRVLDNQSVKIEHQRRRQHLGRVALRELHRMEVVQDHPLSVVVGLASGAQHFSGHLGCRRSPLELTARDRFLDQGVEDVSVPGGWIGDFLSDLHSSARKLVDLVDQPQDGIGHPHPEARSVGVAERNWVQQSIAGQPDSQPPLFRREARRRNEPDHLFPRSVLAANQRRKIDNLRNPVSFDPLEELLDRRRRQRQSHRFLSCSRMRGQARRASHRSPPAGTPQGGGQPSYQ